MCVCVVYDSVAARNSSFFVRYFLFDFGFDFNLIICVGFVVLFLIFAAFELTIINRSPDHFERNRKKNKI